MTASAPRPTKAQALRFHAQTGGSTLTAQQPENNIVRVAVQALSAVCGGAQSLHTNSFDEALALPSEHAATIALRTQQVLDARSRHDRYRRPAWRLLLHRGADRASSSERARELIERVDELGRRGRGGRGRLRAGRDRGGGLPLPDRARGRHRVVVGVNRFTQAADERVELHRLDPEGEQRQRQRTARVRAERDPDAAAAALALVRETALGSDNLLPPLREALRARCTIGEICSTPARPLGHLRRALSHRWWPGGVTA